MNSKLYYDANCPICRNYVRILKLKISGDTITFVPIETDASEFKYVAFNGQEYVGQQAIDALCGDHPEVLKFFFLLPTKYRTTALHAAYTTASTLRTALNRFTSGRKRKPCNCGKKK